MGWLSCTNKGFSSCLGVLGSVDGDITVSVLVLAHKKPRTFFEVCRVGSRFRSWFGVAAPITYEFGCYIQLFLKTNLLSPILAYL